MVGKRLTVPGNDPPKKKLLQLPKYNLEGVSERQKFMFLLLDLPPKPLFVDPHKQIPIPQVSNS